MIQSSLLRSVAGIRHQFEDKGHSPPDPLLRLKQIHSARVLELDLPHPEESGDGIITQGLHPAGIQTADCLPVLMADNRSRAVAAIHAGWRGLNAGILVEGVRRFHALGVSSDDLLVAFGPSIKQCCFEVGPEVCEAFQSQWGDLWSEAPWTSDQPRTQVGDPSRQPRSNNGKWVDLISIARLQLDQHGILATHMDEIPICTYCSTGESGTEWASFRRATHQGTAHQTGRQWSWIQRAP